MSVIRSGLTLIILLLLSGVSMLGAAAVMTGPIPLGPEAEHAALGELLTRQDVRHERLSEKRRLARRLEQDFRSGVDWQTELATLPPQRKGLFLANYEELSRIWLLAKIDGYFGRPERRRASYLDREINNVLAWQMLSANATAPKSPSAGSAKRPSDSQVAALAQWSKLAQKWYAQSSGDERKRITQFVSAVQAHLLTSGFRRMLPGVMTGS
jgi:hypothetical protein